MSKLDLLTKDQVEGINQDRYDTWVRELIQGRFYVDFEQVRQLETRPLLMCWRCACVVPWRHVDLHEVRCNPNA